MATYQEAVTFTDALLDLRTRRGATFSIGAAIVEVAPHSELFDAEALGLKWSEGKRLKTVQLDLCIRDTDRIHEIPVYLAAGEWGDPGSHYLIVYVKRHLPAQQFKLLEVLVGDGDTLHLWTSKQLLPNRDPMLKERLGEWMEQLARGQVVDDRLWIGSDDDRNELLVNILTLTLLKEHLRGHLRIEALSGGLPPLHPLQRREAAALLHDIDDGDDGEDDQEETGAGEALELDDDWEGLRLTPPDTVSRRRRTPERPANVDFAALEDRARRLGEAAERLVVRFEQDYLRSKGKRMLAALVDHTSVTKGDGAGYDVKSYQTNGKPIYIEVKATQGKAGAPFFLTAREWAFARRHPNSFRLYRVYDFAPDRKKGRLFIIRGRDLKRYFDFESALYRLRLNRKPPIMER